MFPNRFMDVPDWDLWRPFGDFQRMRSLMNQLAGGFDPDTPLTPNVGVFPTVNVTENKDNYFVRAEMPGIGINDLDISTTANNITISGERKIAEEEADVKYHRRERKGGKFSRVISLPGNFQSDKVSARLSNGILLITLPKSEESKPKQIAVG